MLEIIERAEATAKVIQRHLAALLANPRQQFAGTGQLIDHGGFGDLEGKPLGRYGSVIKQFLQKRNKGGIIQGGG